MIKNKKFIIRDKKDELLFEGFIIEKEASQSNRISLQAETLDDIFLSFQDEKNPTSGKSLDRKNLNFDNSDEQTYIKKSSQNNLNYLIAYYQHLFSDFNSNKENLLRELEYLKIELFNIKIPILEKV